MSLKNQAIILTYLSGLMQGIALIMYPAAGPIFNDPTFHGLSGEQYGLLFIPQIILAIASSFIAPIISSKKGIKTVLHLGLISNAISMALFSASNYAIGSGSTAFILLMLGTTFLGIGFGFTITAVNPLAYNFFPGKEAAAVTGLHILLGIGTASSSIILNLFLEQGFWWGAGFLISAIMLAMSFWIIPLPISIPEVKKEEGESRKGIPGRIWVYFLVVFLYGACEATFGNWAPIFLENDAGLSRSAASFGLSLFWGAIAVGRLIFTGLSLKFNLRWLHFSMPVIVAAVFFAIPYANTATLAYAALTLAGLGLSFYFPYSISLATAEFPRYAAVVSGMLVAAIQLGTGISTNVIGIFSEQFGLSSIIQYSAGYAALMGIIALALYLSPIKTIREEDFKPKES